MKQKCWAISGKEIKLIADKKLGIKFFWILNLSGSMIRMPSVDNRISAILISMGTSLFIF